MRDELLERIAFSLEHICSLLEDALRPYSSEEENDETGRRKRFLDVYVDGGQINTSE